MSRPVGRMLDVEGRGALTMLAPRCLCYAARRGYGLTASAQLRLRSAWGNHPDDSEQFGTQADGYGLV